MDIILIVVTLLALTLTAIMTTVTWRMSHEVRRRSQARVAALAAEIHNAPSAAGDGLESLRSAEASSNRSLDSVRAAIPERGAEQPSDGESGKVRNPYFPT